MIDWKNNPCTEGSPTSTSQIPVTQQRPGEMDFAGLDSSDPFGLLIMDYSNARVCVCEDDLGSRMSSSSGRPKITASQTADLTPSPLLEVSSHARSIARLQ